MSENKCIAFRPIKGHDSGRDGFGKAQSIDLVHGALKWPDHVHRSNFLKQTFPIPTPTDSDAEVLKKKEERRRTLLQDAAEQ